MDKELIAQMLNRMDKLADQQTDLLVKQTELVSSQKHLSESVDEIKEDLSEIQTVQNSHTEDIREIKESLKESQSFKDFAKEFVLNHPIISFILFLMIVNIVLTSIGLPIIQLAPIWATLVGGN